VYTQGPFDIVTDEMDRVGRFGIRTGGSVRRSLSFGRLENSDFTPLKKPETNGHNGFELPPSSSRYCGHAIEQTAFIQWQKFYYQRSVIIDNIPRPSCKQIFPSFFSSDLARPRPAPRERRTVNAAP
jgi:hypothetical protein